MQATDPPQAPGTVVSTAVPGYFIEVFYRLFKVGIYYPLGHVVLDQAAGNFIQQLREIFPTCKTITLAVESDRLVLENTVVTHVVRSARDLHNFLINLGITSIGVERTITHKQLLQFVRCILAWRVQKADGDSFFHLNCAVLPETIKVVQQDHVAGDSTIPVLNDDVAHQQKTEELYAALGKVWPSGHQVHQCRVLFDKLTELAKGKKLQLQGFPHASWRDVQNLLYTCLVRASLPEAREAVKEMESDAKILLPLFASLEQGLELSKDKKTINLLLSHLSAIANRESTGPPGVQATIKRRAKKPEQVPEISVNALQKLVDDSRIVVMTVGNVSKTDRSEILSIIFQLPHADANPTCYDLCEHRLATILSSPLSAREWSVLMAGIRHFAEVNKADYFGKILAMILVALRSVSSARSYEGLVDLWQEIPKSLQDLLWPHAVNELLVVGMAGERKHFYELTELVCHRHMQTMKNLRPHLETLEAFREKKVASIIFRPSHIYAYPFFAFLLDTSLGAIIAGRVLAELQHEPQDTFMEALGPVLNGTNPAHLQLLKSYLNHAQHGTLPPDLKTEGGQIIVDFLTNISEEQRVLPWLEKTIRALAELPTPGTVELLQRIVGERRLAVLPTWSRCCRQAAEDALYRISTQKTPGLP